MRKEVRRWLSTVPAHDTFVVYKHEGGGYDYAPVRVWVTFDVDGDIVVEGWSGGDCLGNAADCSNFHLFKSKAQMTPEEIAAVVWETDGEELG